ncbi:shikimate dehydrogenase [Sulfurimonas sp. HSL1-2]|uniref:shikimate dehydrogenase n=1 Tax=Thiomicrolovo zhangzhouensis TaxID=3131933 RepID=UPI0031F7790D
MTPSLFAIFGDPVHHSRSPLMHNHVFKRLGFPGCYTRVHLTDGTKLRKTFFDLGLQGANITVPHKEAAYSACDEIRGFAKEVGVVNTIVNENGRLIGYNTDADGFLFAIRNFDNVNDVLILGAGGTARALATRLKQEGKTVHVLNRSAGRLAPFADDGFATMTWDDFTPKGYDLVVNTTSAGLEDDSLPAPEALLLPLLRQSRYGADAIYGKVTPFLALCAENGLQAIDGAEMLLGQGVLANRLFTEERYSAESIEEVMRESFAF